MSLVSYADSDDSGEEDISEPEVKTKVGKNEDKAVKIGTADLQTKAPVDQNKAEQETIDAGDSDITKPKSIGSLFSSLPAPWMSTVTWANKISGKKAGTKGKEQTVKITLPTLADNSDSDDEDYVRKKVMPSTNSEQQKPSGLFSLLPKPKHSVVVKENNPNRPVAKISNRPLIPDSLRRKQAKKPTPKVKKPPAKDDGSDDDSDDNDGGSFFSWNEPKTLKAQDDSTSQVMSGSTLDAGSAIISDEMGKPSNTVTQTRKPDNILPSMKVTPSNDARIPSTISGTIQETKNTENIYTLPQAAEVSTTHSKHFENQRFYMDNNAQGYSYQGTRNPPEYSDSNYQTNESVGYTEPNNPYYDYYNSEQYNQATTEQEPNYPIWPTPAQATIQETPEQFKRFLGKRGRGEENIDIIDVNADDQVGSSQEWKSNYHKEDADYKPQSKKKDNLPSSQQRKKHQITYLAFQAKEKEWELRNQWSANRQTKRQTQSKYGF